MAAARRAWWRSPTNVAAASMIIAGGGLIAWVFFLEYSARLAAQEYCDEQGGATISEYIPDTAIIGYIKSGSAPGLIANSGEVEPDGRSPLTQLAAIYDYYLKKISNMPRGLDLSNMLDPVSIWFPKEPTIARQAYIAPWDKSGPMIIAGTQSKYCTNSIDVDVSTLKESRNEFEDIAALRFCRPTESDYSNIYLNSRNIFNEVNKSFGGPYIHFKGYRIYRLGAKRPVFTDTEVGIQSVFAKMIEILFFFVGGDTSYYGNMCYTPDTIKRSYFYNSVPIARYPLGRYVRQGSEYRQ